MLVPDPGPRLIQDLVSSRGLAFVIQKHRLDQEEGKPLAGRDPRVGQGLIDHRHVTVADLPPHVRDFLEGCLRFPAGKMAHDVEEPAGIQRSARLVPELTPGAGGMSHEAAGRAQQGAAAIMRDHRDQAGHHSRRGSGVRFDLAPGSHAPLPYTEYGSPRETDRREKAGMRWPRQQGNMPARAWESLEVTNLPTRLHESSRPLFPGREDGLTHQPPSAETEGVRWSR